MLKRSALLLALAVTAAFAAPTKGKVVSVKDRIVVVKIEGALGPWIKKGKHVKINQNLKGKITAVQGASVTLALPNGQKLVKGATVTIASPRAKELKKGEKVTFDDSLDQGGC